MENNEEVEQPKVEQEEVTTESSEEIKVQPLTYTIGTGKEQGPRYSLIPNTYNYLRDTTLYVNDNFLVDGGDLHGVYNTDEATAIMNSADHAFGTYVNPTYNDFLSNPLESDITFGKTTIKNRLLNVKPGKGEKSALSKLSRAVSAGDVIQIPLWNSGFWITIKTLTGRELALFKRRLDKVAIDVERATAGATPLSNKSGLLYKVLMDTIESKLVSTTLALSEGESIRKYAVIDDLVLIANGAVSSMYPFGVNVTLACANSTRLDKEGKPHCTTFEAGLLHTEKIVKVDKVGRVDDYMLEIMSRREPGSVTVQNVEEYRNRIMAKIPNKSMSLNTSNSAGEEYTIKFNYHSPSISNYFRKTQRWYEEISRDVEATLTVSTMDDSEELFDSLVSTSMLGIYDNYVKSIEIDGESITSDDGIRRALNSLSDDDDVYTEYFKGINKFIGSSPIAIIATNNYICDKCKGDESKPHHLEEDLIPLEPLNYFLDQLRLKLEYMEMRSQ